jgi:putative tryptophan/tyrosine transport system substrate-binding protein
VALAPDLIFAPGSGTVGPLQQAPRSVPIVFVLVVDPAGSGFVDSLARPGGNATGFTSYDYGIGAKWLEVLKEIAPSVTRAAVIRDPAVASGLGYWAAIQSVSPSAAIEVSAHHRSLSRGGCPDDCWHRHPYARANYRWNGSWSASQL